MSKRFPSTSSYNELAKILLQVGKWLLISLAVGILTGAATAGFLLALNQLTSWRESHLWIIAFLPLAGLLVGLLYHYLGKSVEAGNNLIIEEIHNPRAIVPLRMTPLVLLGTFMTHLFGGSAGREGTAVQMGGSLADQLTGPLRLKSQDRRIILMAGMSAGVASVFGTPLAGTFFGLEVLSIGRMRYEALFPCLMSALIGNQVALALGVHYSTYAIASFPAMTLACLLSSILAGALFGIVGMLFARSTRWSTHWMKSKIPYTPLRSLLGGGLVSLLVWSCGAYRYIGLGIPTIMESFKQRLPPWSFISKFFLTVLTLASGLKGGEVTPLFFIGATMGNALSYLLPLPLDLLAGMGFVGVFAGAANTPLASILMAVELFGPGFGVYAAIACVSSYLFSGHAGIYGAQLAGHRKDTGNAN